MTTAALITAAGMSSRMGDFKPMLNVGSISIAQRVVATFQQEGAKFTFHGKKSGVTKGSISASNGEVHNFTITVRKSSGWL